MQKSLSPLQVVLLLNTAIFLVVYHADAGWSASVDLAHHYALAFRISEHWHLLPADPTLGEMNIYPRVSHVAAAIVGMLFHSTFMGVQLVALAALALAWGCYLAILYMLPGRTGPASALALALLVVVNHFWLGLEIHGAEIAVNFFFSQLVAQALALLAVAIALRLEVRKTKPHVYAFIMVAIYLITFVHLLAAIELLALFAGLLLVDTLSTAAPPRQRLVQAATSACLLAVSVASVVLNPTFAAMRLIAENNGGLDLGLFSSKWALVILCLTTIGAAGGLLRVWWRDERQHTAKFLALYGGGIAMLCLLQILLLQFHVGSEYAVKKYVFGINSFLFVCVARALGIAASDWLEKWTRVPSDSVSGIVPTLALAVAMWATFTYAPHWEKLLDTSDVVAFEQRLLNLRDSTLTPPAAGKNNIVIDLNGQPPTINYMFALAITKTPRDAALDLILGNKLGAMEKYDTIVSSRGESRYDGRGCERTSSGPLVTFDAACLHKAIADNNVCKGTFDFSVKGGLAPAMLAGFSAPEQASRWTDAPVAKFTCRAGVGYHVAKIFVTPFVTAQHQRQRIAFSVNGGTPVSYEFKHPAEGRFLELPLENVAPGQTMTFSLDMPDAVSPQALGLSADGRMLGMAVRTLSFE